MLTTEVAARLERKLGLGAFPLVRRRMYQRLQRLALQHGDPVVEIIAQVEMEALGPKIRDGGQYFCWVVKRRLEELGFALQPSQGPPPAVPLANQAKAIVAEQAAGTQCPPDLKQQSELERLRLSNELLMRERDAARRFGEGGKW